MKIILSMTMKLLNLIKLYYSTLLHKHILISSQSVILFPFLNEYIALKLYARFCNVVVEELFL